MSYLHRIGYNIKSAFKRLKLKSACPVGKGLVAVSSEGDLLPCSFLQDLTLGNVKNISSNTLLPESFLNYVNDYSNLKGGCGSCTYKELCRGCRVKAYLSSNDLMGEDPSCILQAN